MASEYLLKKAREQQKPAPEAPMTREEKIKNWFDYNKWWLVVWAVLAAIIVSIVLNALGVGQVKPDYIFALVTDSAADGALVESLDERFSVLADDRNGDGSVNVEIRAYALANGGDLETAMYYNYAANTVLIADITAGESAFFITDKPEKLQRELEIYADENGEPAEGGDIYVLPVGDTGLFVGRRCYYGEMAEGRESEIAMWDRIKEALS